MVTVQPRLNILRSHKRASHFPIPLPPPFVACCLSIMSRIPASHSNDTPPPMVCVFPVEESFQYQSADTQRRRIEEYMRTASVCSPSGTPRFNEPHPPSPPESNSSTSVPTSNTVQQTDPCALAQPVPENYVRDRLFSKLYDL